MTQCFRTPWHRLMRCVPLAVLAVICVTGCTSPREGLDDFVRWHEQTRQQAEAGMLRWSDFYHQSYDRLAALPSSLQQDLRLEQTVLLLSNAEKLEAAEMSLQQFKTEQALIEQRQVAALH